MERIHSIFIEKSAQSVPNIEDDDLFIDFKACWTACSKVSTKEAEYAEDFKIDWLLESVPTVERLKRLFDRV